MNRTTLNILPLGNINCVRGEVPLFIVLRFSVLVGTVCFIVLNVNLKKNECLFFSVSHFRTSNGTEAIICKY